MSCVNRDDTKHIYYDVRIDNAYNGVDSSSSSNCSYQKQSIDILEKQSNYELCVEHWSLRGQIPVMIAKIQEGNNTNINLMPFSVCFESATGVDFKQDLIYTPPIINNSISNPRPPSQNNGLQDNSTRYYHIYTFQLFIDIINNAFESAYQAFNAVNVGIHASAPWVQYNYDTGTLRLIAEYSYSSNGPVNKAKVFCNALLFNYLESICVLFNGYNQTNGKDYQFDFTILVGNVLAYAIPPNLLANPPDYVQLQQEYDLRYLWCNVKQILITSGSISTREEYLPEIVRPQSIERKNNPFNPASLPLLSYYDIVLNGGDGASWRQYIYYEPKVRKWIDLVSDNALNNISIDIFIQLDNGEILPLSLPSDGTANIRLLFRRKENIF
jgi:hypothetical protein